MIGRFGSSLSVSVLWSPVFVANIMIDGSIKLNLSWALNVRVRVLLNYAVKNYGVLN